MSGRLRDDRGSVLVLGVGLVAVAMVAIGAGVDASRLFLARRALTSLADGTALRGAHDLNMATLYGSGATDVLPLSVSQVRADVTAYVAAQSAANGLRGVHVTGVSVGGGVVRVELAMTESVPVVGVLLGSPQGELVTATAAARTAVQ